MKYIIGQVIGVVASVVSVLNPVFKKKWQMLVNNMATNLLMGLNLVFLGEIGSGIFLFCVAVVQSAINLLHTLRQQEVKRVEKMIFFALYVGLGLYGLFTSPDFIPGINWQNLKELLPIIGAVFSMCFVFAPKEQNARKFLLCCDSTWAIYYIIIGSTALLGSLSSMTVCTISILRYHRLRKKEQTVKEQ